MWTRAICRVRQSYLGWRYGRINKQASLGTRGEQAAAQLLRRKGLVVVAQSETDRGGEIDLIAVDPRLRTVIFVEVKTQGTNKAGHPAERDDIEKQGRLTRAAMRYLRRKQLLGVAARFDVVAVWWTGPQSVPERIEHYESAFEATGRHQFFS